MRHFVETVVSAVGMQVMLLEVERNCHARKVFLVFAGCQDRQAATSSDFRPLLPLPLLQYGNKISLLILKDM